MMFGKSPGAMAETERDPAHQVRDDRQIPPGGCVVRGGRKSLHRGGQCLAALAPQDADVADMAAAIVDVVDTTHGKRPFRVHIDPADDGAAVVNAVADRIRTEFLTHIGLDDLLHPPEIVAA